MLVVMEAPASAHPQGVRPAKRGRRKHRDTGAVAFARKSAPLLERRRGFGGHCVENCEEVRFLHGATPVCRVCATPSRLAGCGDSGLLSYCLSFGLAVVCFNLSVKENR